MTESSYSCARKHLVIIIFIIPKLCLEFQQLYFYSFAVFCHTVCYFCLACEFSIDTILQLILIPKTWSTIQNMNSTATDSSASHELHMDLIELPADIEVSFIICSTENLCSQH